MKSILKKLRFWKKSFKYVGYIFLENESKVSVMYSNDITELLELQNVAKNKILIIDQNSLTYSFFKKQEDD